MNNFDCCWDQRIPNEPLFERQFLIQRPPIIVQGIPENTSPCARAPSAWLGLKDELSAIEYWYNNVINKDHKGPNTKDKGKFNLVSLIRQYPTRPWLYSTRLNVDIGSQLSSRDYYNPKDHLCTGRDYSIADQSLVDQMTTRRPDTQSTRIWGQPTSMKMAD